MKKIKYFALIFTPVYIWFITALLTIGFSQVERQLIILIWLLIRHRHVWDDEQHLHLSHKQIVIYILLFILTQKISSAITPLASLLSRCTFEEITATLKNIEHIRESSVIIAPVIEEWAYRGISQQMAYKCFGNIYIAIIIQAVVFGAAHGNWYQCLSAIPLGILNGYLYHKHKNLKLCIATHAISNWLVLKSW